ncbi:PTS glucose transporter subunit IIA [Lactiplantibacillus paraxiangfangensis]|uniref:PTS glucose transporter subunit IIA n=1 Tax=Lactiplantibacillus paraxiangfangensis TaxID=3076224 RepID=UPI0030C73ADD
MGLFSFGKRVKLYAPVDGKLTDLAENTGFSVEPSNHHIYSPVTGTVSTLAPEQNVIELMSGKVLVRVRCSQPLAGETATYVHEGDTVTPATPIAFMDQDVLEEADEDATVRVTVDKTTNWIKKLRLSTSGQVSHDQKVGKLIAR